MHLEQLAFYDQETGLPNENSLRRVLDGKERILVLLNISGYETATITKNGEADWAALLCKIALYLKENL